MIRLHAEVRIIFTGTAGYPTQAVSAVALLAPDGIQPSLVETRTGSTSNAVVLTIVITELVSLSHFLSFLQLFKAWSGVIAMKPKQTVIDLSFFNTLLGAFIVLAAFAFSGIAHADEGSWNDTDKALLAAVETSYYLDFRQTRQIALNPRRYYEKNQLLGEHPSVGRVNNYFLASAIGTYLLADALPEKYRRLFLSGALTVEVITIARNHKLGLRYNF